MGGVGLRHEAVNIEQDRVIRARGIRLDLGENRLKQVVVMDLGIETIGRKSPDRAGDEPESGPRVHRRLVLRQHDERGAGLVESGVHARSDFHPAGQGEPDVDSVGHLVGFERAADFGGDGFVRGDFLERERRGRMAEPVEMLSQTEDASPVESQPFPHRVASLNRGVERADSRLVTMHQPAVDADDQILVPRIEGLQHGRGASTVQGALLPRLANAKANSSAISAMIRSVGR